ncbi:hypothetical protein K435DRAFT_47190 [Dendrothele bispora CBS 962.96]|uniref:Uncharacterized protein n=1 Tax=Dendrothele bispora (strain CBS 962.96) TaxID=1314807 RepID=A0A4S8KSF1_DENBC|nr:hypothetical protein K435DRAFT_47190 [Dendrothele bispora CBS 962.96]
MCARLPPHPLSLHSETVGYKMATFFPQASQFSIQGQTINLVAGDQVMHNQVHSGNSDSIVSPGVLGTQSIFDDYEIIRRGNLRLLGEISKEVIDENDYYHYRRAHRLRAQKRLKFTRSAYRAQVIGQNLPPSVAVVYEGEDAQTVGVYSQAKAQEPTLRLDNKRLGREISCSVPNFIIPISLIFSD